ncbi:MAG: SMP-30/gluconolactonase/LRE family protein [Promethearchaeota archaeon]
MSKTINLTTKILLKDLKFPEALRWYDNKLWFSDMETRKITSVDMKGTAKSIIEIPNRPSGLGWLPDGSLLVVSMEDRKLLQLESGIIKEFMDLSGFATYPLNDMVVNEQGYAYIGHFGFDYINNQPFVPATIIMVTSERKTKIVAKNMSFPNGMVITPDGKTLIVAETLSARLTAFDIRNDGTLNNRRLWANLKSIPPDGICLDEKGAVWVAAPGKHKAVRVLEGGEITHAVNVKNDAYACMLGGPNLTTLFIATSRSHQIREKGQIEYVEVEVPKAGFP